MNKYIGITKKIIFYTLPISARSWVKSCSILFCFRWYLFHCFLCMSLGLCRTQVLQVWNVSRFKGTGSIFLFYKPIREHFLILCTCVYLAQQNRCTYVGCGESHDDHSTTHSQVCVFAANTVPWSNEVKEHLFQWSQ